MHVTVTLCKRFDQPLTPHMVRDVLSLLLVSGFDITTVEVVNGKPLIDGEREVQLELTAVSFDDQSRSILEEALSMMLFKLPFKIISTGSETATPKEQLGVVLGKVVSDYLSRQKYEQDARDEAYRSRQDEDTTEEWRLIRDERGVIVDYIYAD